MKNILKKTPKKKNPTKYKKEQTNKPMMNREVEKKTPNKTHIKIRLNKAVFSIKSSLSPDSNKARDIGF